MFHSSCIRNLVALYSDYQITGSGIYFPRLHVFSGGLILWHSLIKILDTAY